MYLNKRKTKEEKGITLIALAVTIIVLLILAGITINTGLSGTDEARENAKLSELGMVQHAILQRKTKIDLTHEEYPGQTIEEANIDLDGVIREINANKSSEEEAVVRKDTNNENYYLLTNSNGGFSDLGISDSEDEYIVNYETGEVINYTTKVTKSGKPLYIYSID